MPPRLHRIGSALWRLPRRALVLLLRGYRLLLSPWLGASCRFHPTCSAYAIEALERHGALAGSLLTTGRLLRCHPWCTPGDDPVPARPWRPFTGLLPGSSAPTPSNLKKPSP
ncbi:membrane protein insertion efficiency factor YidD [Piscinibacter sakaiensis]|uniref:Putative membrane protein insertion efficiency factor n=1 Tax=Piscinibacter sakaiensis TaxID=1547922 RepID=A0A0K8P6K1_PISS1|nr:membrane protein insertion efficiency factor YidD [Piscinibacter sakaiensis]GAP37840.1 YidD protein [Piscinibacter sakaiensis]